MFVSILPSPPPSLEHFVDLVVVTNQIALTTLGRLTFRHENGLNYNALGPFRPPVELMLLSSSIVLCTFLVGLTPVVPYWVI